MVPFGVRWRNDGLVTHTVTSTDVPDRVASFDNGDIEYQNFYDRAFTTPGTYVYRCDDHPQEMLGATVIVR